MRLMSFNASSTFPRLFFDESTFSFVRFGGLVCGFYFRLDILLPGFVWKERRSMFLFRKNRRQQKLWLNDHELRMHLIELDL